MNEGYVHRERIDARAAGQGLLAYLSARYAHSSPAEWAAHLAAGRVALDGVPGQAHDRLRHGQELAWHRPPWDEPDAPLALALLYDAGGLLVVAKPAGLPTLPGGGFLQHTLLHQLRLLHPDASPLHRLGRWTSGAVLCARTSGAAASVSAQFVARTIHKRYRALASGRPALDRFEITAPIGPVAYPPLGLVHAADPGGRHASSSVVVLRRGDDSSLCDVTIATGRPHQIRIHLASAGHPLVGDPLYGARGLPIDGGVALPGDPGYLLHSAEIGFVCPDGGGPVRVLAPPPADLSVDGA